MLYTFFSWACAVVTLVALLYRLPALISNPRNLALSALCVYFLFNSIAYFVDLDSFRGYFTKLLGFPNATTIAVQVSVVILTAAQQVTVVNLTLPPQRARRATRWLAGGFGLAIAALVLLFIIIHPHKEANAQETVYLNLQDAGYAFYFAAYLTVCAAGRFQTVLFAFKYSRTIPDLWLRLGMRLVAGGSALILVYCGVRYWQIAALHVAGIIAPWKFLFWLIADIGTLMQIVGWTIPVWGPKLETISRWIGSYRSYVRLAPLWQAVYRAVPGIALENPPSGWLAWIPPRPLDYHLYRRVIEIRDAELMLRQSADPIALHCLDQAQGLAHEALCEAAVLRSALQANITSTPQSTNGQQERSVRQGAPDRSLRQEIANLIQVSRAFQALDGRVGTMTGPRSG
ncbi:MAB_1171c family putative transporter [Streptomyces sp. NPDC048523]|uniref:MAB_1171c family putative transporter n=1 Tax=Streptomyces sp. NPDC048523 TaxID=3365567 RepID=UPI00372493ED